MAELKTKPTDKNIDEFLNSFVDNEQKLNDSYKLIDFFKKVTGYEPQIWGESIIGFGKYHYKSEKSKQEGDWFLVGFSPRKAAISLYVYSGDPKHEYLLNNLGKFKIGKACIYIKKLSDLNLETLKKLISETIKYTQEKWGNN